MKFRVRLKADPAPGYHCGPPPADVGVLESTMRSFAPSVLILAAACQTAVEAPATLEGALKSTFTNFETEDVRVLQVAVVKMMEEMEAFNLTDEDSLARAVSPSALTHEELGGVTPPPDTDPADQVPVALFGQSVHDFDANRTLAGEPNQVCIESNSTKFYARTFTTDEACFVDGTCEFLRTTNEVRKENIIAKAWYDLFKDYRAFELEDGTRVVLSRSWIEEVFFGDGGGNSFSQTFTTEAWIDDGDKTDRMYTMWAEINIGLGDDIMEGQIRDGLDEGFFNADQFLSDDLSECGADRERAYDRDEE
jgi:hypothetical protein